MKGLQRQPLPSSARTWLGINSRRCPGTRAPLAAMVSAARTPGGGAAGAGWARWPWLAGPRGAGPARSPRAAACRAGRPGGTRTAPPATPPARAAAATCISSGPGRRRLPQRLADTFLQGKGAHRTLGYSLGIILSLVAAKPNMCVMGVNANSRVRSHLFI